MQEISSRDLQALALGSSLLASSGGQSTDSIIKAVKGILSHVKVVQPHDLPMNTLIAPVEYMGSPDPNAHRSIDGHEFRAIFQKITKDIKKKWAPS